MEDQNFVVDPGGLGWRLDVDKLESAGDAVDLEEDEAELAGDPQDRGLVPRRSVARVEDSCTDFALPELSHADPDAAVRDTDSSEAHTQGTTIVKG